MTGGGRQTQEQEDETHGVHGAVYSSPHAEQDTRGMAQTPAFRCRSVVRNHDTHVTPTALARRRYNCFMTITQHIRWHGTNRE